ncbi:MAG: hypothetical protein JWQ23_3118 [Herminiimonas sp.]|nr:hypothetical protein [Herminiimonas sp.]
MWAVAADMQCMEQNVTKKPRIASQIYLRQTCYFTAIPTKKFNALIFMKKFCKKSPRFFR